MKKILCVLIILGLITTGCSNVKTYTFQKERVDQRHEGNRGYIMGTPPPAPTGKEIPKRTMFGIDIEIPVLPYEKSKIPQEEVVYEEEDIYIEEDVIRSPASQEATNFEPKRKASEETEVIEEDIWVK